MLWIVALEMPRMAFRKRRFQNFMGSMPPDHPSSLVPLAQSLLFKIFLRRLVCENTVSTLNNVLEIRSFVQKIGSSSFCHCPLRWLKAFRGRNVLPILCVGQLQNGLHVLELMTVPYTSLKMLCSILKLYIGKKLWREQINVLAIVHSGSQTALSFTGCQG